MVEELDDPAVNRTVIVLWENHAHDLVLQAEATENKGLKNNLAAIRKVQRIMRSRSAVGPYGRMCPGCPDITWRYFSAVSR
jgi:hypothetical protein